MRSLERTADAIPGAALARALVADARKATRTAWYSEVGLLLMRQRLVYCMDARERGLR